MSNNLKAQLAKFSVSKELAELLHATDVLIPASRNSMIDAIMPAEQEFRTVDFEVPGRGLVPELTIARCKNGLAINFIESYMRRRDPRAMVIADQRPTDKTRYRDRFGKEFDDLRSRTFEWLKNRKALVVLPFISGTSQYGYPSLCVAPLEAVFFVVALADLQGFIPAAEIPDNFKPMAVLYVAPPFRHTDFDGKQVVVHNRTPEVHELFSYNLYPGPAAKKGIYGVLLNRGEEEGWITFHCSTVRLVTPYDNEFVIMHEGASGCGKSEMIQQIHREIDGRILLGRNTITNEKIYLELSDTCALHPVTDDMALAPQYLQKRKRKLVVMDAEDAWFLRVDHLKEYGTEPTLERLCIDPPQSLIFLNLDGKPGATCLLWEHTMDAPDKPCPNPRVIVPRNCIEHTINEPVEVDVRSFGVRTPPSTNRKPNYGIIGMLHILPPAIAWLWRLVAPRGHSNPSIVTSEGLKSEGVGSYWPFATGLRVRHANLLLETMRTSPRTRYVLIPNQYIGAYHVGFMPEWIAREYMARRGSVIYRPGQLIPSLYPLLGYTPPDIRVNGQQIPRGLLRVNEQLEVASHGFEAGAEILQNYFEHELKTIYNDALHPKGRTIIEYCLNHASLEEYERLLIS